MLRKAAVTMSEALGSNAMYYFWLYDWSTRTIDVLTRVRPVFALCEVHRDELSVMTPGARFSTSLTDIKEIRLWRWASAGAKVTINVEFKFTRPMSLPGQDTPSAVLYLVPLDVYTFDTSLKESEDLVSVISVFKSGKTPDAEPNPYLRRKRPRWSISRSKMNAGIDPTTPPYQSTEPTYTLQVFLLTIVVTVVVAMITIPIMGIIMNALLGIR